MYDISVIICAYTEERWNDLVAAVASVQQQTVPCRDIIIVIDHNPRLLQRAQEQWPMLIVTENTQAQGLRGARNCGVALAQGEIIAFLDDDAVAIPNWLLFLTEGYADVQVLGTGGAVTPAWDNKPTWFPEEFYWVVGCTYRGMPQTNAVLRNPIGANMSFRREVFDTIGDFGGDAMNIGAVHVGGCEETEFCIRVHQHWPQHKILYSPQANVFHHVPQKRTNWHYFWSRCHAEGVAKVSLMQNVGADDALASERNYTLQALPKGVIRGLSDAVFHLDPAGLARAEAIVVGLTATLAGYVRGTVCLRAAQAKDKLMGKKSFEKKRLTLHTTTQ